jgi:hypothetical protein
MADEREERSLSEEIAERWDPERLLRLVSRRAGRGERLDATTRAHFERKLGVDLGEVRIYTGEFAEQVTEAHRAEAVTIGRTGMILMRGSADRSPISAAGRALLAHELTHVAQATRGLHRRATFAEETPLATEEHEAEAEAAEAEEQGGAASAAAGEVDEEAQREAVLARVLELLEEEDRVSRIRSGDPPYRP